jgi:hypothetical protein
MTLQNPDPPNVQEPSKPKYWQAPVKPRIVGVCSYVEKGRPLPSPILM